MSSVETELLFIFELFPCLSIFHRIIHFYHTTRRAAAIINLLVLTTAATASFDLSQGEMATREHFFVAVTHIHFHLATYLSIYVYIFQL